MSSTAHLVLAKAAWIDGHRLRLRNAHEDDAAFIFGLRHDPARNRHMSPTSPELEDQRQWLARYAADQAQAYFIIETLQSPRPGASNASDDHAVPGDAPATASEARRTSVGTVRLYDAQGDSFCWGSWMLMPGAPPFAAIESALMVYAYALGLGFKAAHFDVQEDNAAVRRFHENFGAVRTGQVRDQIQYTLSHERILESMQRYRRFLPDGIRLGPGA